MSDHEPPRPGTPAGASSREEILSQPGCWRECLEFLERKEIVSQVRERFAQAEEWLFVGCGSSYYIALSAAASWSALTGRRARALPASELLLFPELALSGSRNVAPVLISRSGRTSEVLRAAEFLEKQRGIHCLAVTCAADQPLEKLATLTLVLPADEKSTVMTRSFTSMLMGLQYCAARMGNAAGLADDLRKTADHAETVLASMHPRIRDFVGAHEFADYVFLGQGPYYGMACESALKITEMSVSYAQCFHTLEFRHGPKSIAGPETLVVFLLSESNYAVECEVMQEVKGLGGRTLAVCNRADDRARGSADLLIELNFDGPEIVRLAPYVFAGQLLGLYTGLKKGLDPDSPRHLSRVVVLEEEKSAGNPEHAAL